jgi:hypothetical protein
LNLTKYVRCPPGTICTDTRPSGLLTFTVLAAWLAKVVKLITANKATIFAETKQVGVDKTVEWSSFTSNRLKPIKSDGRKQNNLILKKRFTSNHHRANYG